MLDGNVSFAFEIQIKREECRRSKWVLNMGCNLNFFLSRKGGVGKGIRVKDLGRILYLHIGIPLKKEVKRFIDKYHKRNLKSQPILSCIL